MGKFLESTFFSDRVRGLISIFLLVLIAGFLLFQTAFPHKPTLDKETLQSLQQVTEVLRTTASNLEVTSQGQAELNDSLKKKIGELDVTRKKDYAELLKTYGLDVDLPTSGDLDDGHHGVQQRSDDQRRKPVPPGSVPAGADKHLQTPATGHEEKTDASHP